MKSTPNPLHEFRSYTYHHILIACDNTDVAEALGKLSSDPNQNVGSFTNEIFSKRGAERGVVVNTYDGGKYCVVINGARDSEFFIKNASWQTFVAPNLDVNLSNESSVTSMALEGEMEIVEPKGFRFMNVVNEVGQKLGTGPTAITWVLKTIFIGHTDSKVPRFITNVKPLLFMLVNISAKFDEGGSYYVIPFLGQANGASRTPQYSKLPLNHFTWNRQTHVLKDAMVDLESKLNSSYQQSVFEARRTCGELGIELKGKEIRYSIVLDDAYLSDEYMIDEARTHQSGDGTSESGGITFGNVPVEYKISSMMRHCSKVNSDARDDNEGQKSIFKVHSILNVKNSEAVVTYYIKQYKVSETPTPMDVPDISDNILVYNYLYTGKNIDIREFDIKMEMGLAFFQLLSVTPSLSDDQLMAGSQHEQRHTGSRGQVDKIWDNGIIFPSTDYQHMFDLNKRHPLTASEFQTALSKHAEIETLEAQVKVHGNPWLLNDMNTLPSEYGGDPLPNGETSFIPAWFKRPALCKINISMPRMNTLVGTEVGQSFQVPFWYQGYYSLIGIRHNFTDGIFSQDLSMLSVPTRDPMYSDPMEETDHPVPSESPVIDVTNFEGLTARQVGLPNA